MGTIFVIEDDKYILMSIFNELENVGFKVITAKNIDEARSKLDETTCQYIVSDIELGDNETNCLELFRERLNSGVNIPTLFLSSRSDLENEAMRYGARSFFKKTEIEEMCAFIKKELLEKRQ